jgi:uncharacterized membrane protein YphA (DoxX/SURF4 family)
MQTVSALAAVETPAEPVAVPLAVPAVPAAMPWSRPRLWAFRFVFAYFLLYNLGFLFYLIPIEGLRSGYDAGWHLLVAWVGAHVLHLSDPITVFPNGSGDTTYNYVEVLCFGLLALLSAVSWSAVDRKPRRHERLQEWMFIALRYVLASTMLSYGFSKVFRLQFPAPLPSRLLQPYGESSPMGLLWTFMGASGPYTIFAGAAEVCGGLLLFWRRTATLGAVIIAAVMTNVVMMNLCYDVPVKLYSSHLLGMAVVIALPDARRLANVLVFHRATTPGRIDWPLGGGRLVRYGRLVLKTAVVGYFVTAQLTRSFDRLAKSGDAAPKIVMYGVYEVLEYEQDGVKTPSPWRRIGVSNNGFSLVRLDGTALRLSLKDDPKAKTLTLAPRTGEPGESGVLTYRRPVDGEARLEGRYGERTICLRLKPLDTSKSLLVSRGYHWINEYPFNR